MMVLSQEQLKTFLIVFFESEFTGEKAKREQCSFSNKKLSLSVRGKKSL